ncbi:MAG: hypothetical protein AB1403_21730 [Candidatus Riflebacteria bacterium]
MDESFKEFRPWISLLQPVRKKLVTTALLSTIALGSILGIHRLSADVTLEGLVTWGQMRTFISKAYRMTNSELDALFARVVKQEPDSSTLVNANNLLELEVAVKKRLRDSRAELFPNPFFSKPLKTVNHSGTPPFVFIDVSLDHPAYRALSCLIEIGLPCCDEKKRLRPDEKITLSEWEKALNDLGRLLGIDNLSGLCTENTSNNAHLSINELNHSIRILRQKFSLSPSESDSTDSSNCYPTRLQALSKLSSLIGEFN